MTPVEHNIAARLREVILLAEFGTTGQRTEPPCQGDAMSQHAATVLRGTISELARTAYRDLTGADYIGTRRRDIAAVPASIRAPDHVDVALAMATCDQLAAHAPSDGGYADDTEGER